VMALSIVIWIVVTRSRGQRWAKAVFVAGSVAFLSLFAEAGLASNSSLLDRFTVWRHVLEEHAPTLIGYGIGYSGAASTSRFAEQTVVVDNYFLSLFIQFGLFSALLLVPLAAWSLSATYRSAKIPMLRSSIVIVASIVGFWFVDFWEYS